MLYFKRIFSSLFIFIISVITLSFKSEPDPLNRREFNISLSETKNGAVAKKVTADKLSFKNGKLRSEFLYKKFGYKYIGYRINKDSIFTDSTNTEVRLLEVEAVVTDDHNQSIFINFTTSEWDIDGVIKITKNDKIKRYYDFSGREKGGKPKKIKPEKENKPVLELVN